MKREKFTLEFVFNSCSHSVLWSALSTPEGLKDWFADDVIKKEDIWSFVWDGSEQEARRIACRSMRSVRFRWNDEPHETFFEFKISEDDLTGNVTLSVTDFAEKGDVEDSKRLWQKQVEVLGTRIGAR